MIRSAASGARNGGPAERRGDVLVSRLPVLRAALEQQRDFRREQLAHVDVHQPTHRSPVMDDPTDRDAALAMREVEALVRTGARRALADIELALARMHTGCYGYCRVCSAGIAVVVLEAIPTTTVCLACQQSTEHARDQPAAADPIRAGATAPRRQAARPAAPATTSHRSD